MGDAYMQAAREGRESDLREYLDTGSDPNAQKESNGTTVLIMSVIGDHYGAARLLIDRGADTNTMNKFGWAPLMIAARHGRTSMIRLLGSQGAAIDATDIHGRSAIYHAMAAGHVDAVEALLDLGVSLSEFDDTGLLGAAVFGGVRMVRMILDRGYDVDEVGTYSWTALIRAVERRKEDVAQLLIERGADIHRPERHGWTALGHAASLGHDSMAWIFLERGASVPNGVLMYVVRCGFVDVMRLLLEYGANPRAKAQGYLQCDDVLSLLEMAKEREHADMVSLLETYLGYGPKCMVRDRRRAVEKAVLRSRDRDVASLCGDFVSMVDRW